MSAPPRGPTMSALAAIGSRLGDLAEARAALFALELRDEARRACDVLVLAAAAAVLLHLALLMGAALIVLAFWDTHRLLAAGGMGLLYGACASAVFLRLRARAAGMTDAFQATREEFRQDLAAARGRP